MTLCRDPTSVTDLYVTLPWRFSLFLETQEGEVGRIEKAYAAFYDICLLFLYEHMHAHLVCGARR